MKRQKSREIAMELLFSMELSKNSIEETIEMFISPLEPGQKVKVIKGPLAGLEGELVEVEGKSKVVVRLDLLGCAGVDMPVGYIEAANK